MSVVEYESSEYTHFLRHFVFSAKKHLPSAVTKGNTTHIHTAHTHHTHTHTRHTHTQHTYIHTAYTPSTHSCTTLATQCNANSC